MVESRPNERRPNATEATRIAEALIAGPRVSAITRRVLEERIASPVARAAVSCLGEKSVATLTAACARLLPPDSPVQAADIAAGIDARLSCNGADGWRYDALPPDREAFARMLEAWNEPRSDFTSLDANAQDAMLRATADGSGGAADFDSRLWFMDLLAEVSEAHVSHPATQVQMGCDAFADVPLDASRRPITPTRDGLAPASLRRHAESDIVDAVVIGTGAGGGPLLWRLAGAGLSVVALEAGRHWSPADDFATDEKAQSKLFWNDERLAAGADPIAFGSNNSGIGVGGSTLHYTAYMPRPQPDDFRLASEFGVGVDWPIGYDELEPYFDALEACIGVSGPSSYPWGPKRNRAYPMPALPLNAPARLMQAACAELGIATSPAANAALSQERREPGLPTRHACTQRGFCQAGCTTGAKGSVDVVFIGAALARGAELRTDSFATRIERDANGHVSAVVYVQGSVERRQRCRHVFLCGGAIETPRLLLMNDGLANASGQVGRNFMAHCGQQLWGFFDAPTEPWRGIPGGLISEAMHRPKGTSADFAGGYLLQSIGVMPVTYAMQLARSGRGLFGTALGEHLARFDHVAGINILGECLPAAGNFLELSSEVDARGLPKPRIHFSAGENEHKLTAHADMTMRAIWSAAGAADTWAFPRFAHVIGTCRMGDDRERAVVDRDGRSFDVPGLYICDNSVFPSALSVNPSLVIMALSLRTADRFLARPDTKARP